MAGSLHIIHMRYTVFIICTVLLSTACNIRKAIHPTAREKYERSYKGPDSLLQTWKQAYNAALQQPVNIELPLVVTARLHDSIPHALAYRFAVNQGQVLITELDRTDDSTLLFAELLRYKKNDPSKTNILQEIESTATLLEMPVTENDTITIILQPGINNRSLFRFRIYAQPGYAFPVAGKGNTAITSFWGADRDGGGRKHEGVDIVAGRGTPLLAVMDGRITSTGDRGLGGKQVWLRDAVFKKSVYYAHLDSIAARDGQTIKRGDTLGFVGNTGNAITTIPHLHFGVYGNNGATDPYLFIKQLPVPSFHDSILIRKGITRNNKNELRAGPSAKHALLQTVGKNESLTILGKLSNWYYVKKGAVSGFILQSNIKPVS